MQRTVAPSTAGGARSLLIQFPTHRTNRSYISMSKSIPGKLSPHEVRRIRDLYATGDYTQRELAAKYNVSQRTIWFHTTKCQLEPGSK